MKRLSALIETQAQAQHNNKVNGFVILKPGFLGHEDEFIKLLKNNDWRIIQKKRGTLTQEQAEALYKQHSDKPFFKDLCKYMCSDECLCCACQKECADPIKDMKVLKDKVRDKWGEDELKNAMHSSDTIENVEREGNIVFNGINESLDYYAKEDIPETGTSINDVIHAELMSLYAEEINAFYQYWIVSEFLVGKERPNIQKKYQEYAMDELTDHAAKLLKRMNELNMSPGTLTDLYMTNDIAKAKYIVPDFSFTTQKSVAQNINAEIAAINHYREVIRITEDVDPVTNQLLKDILKDEEEHKTELEDFLKDIVQTEQDEYQRATMAVQNY